MRLASFNLENLFDRAKAFNLDSIAEGKVVLDKFGRLNKIFAKPTYSVVDKKAILDGIGTSTRRRAPGVSTSAGIAAAPA